MKLLDKIRGKEEIPSTVALDEIDIWLDIVSKSMFRVLSKNPDQLYKEIKSTGERLKKDTAALKEAKPDETIPPRISKIGLPSRDKMVKHLNSLTKKMVIPTKTDYKTVISFYSATTSDVEFVYGKSLKSLYHVRSLFPDEIEEVTSDLKRLRNALNQLITPIKGKESLITNLDQVPKMGQDLKDLSSEIENEKKELSNKKDECLTLKKRIKTNEERVKLIEGGEEWMELKNLEDELSSSEEELRALKSDINELFTPISKALKLLKKQNETGRYVLPPEEERVLSLILSSPNRAIDEDIRVIGDFLLSVKNIIEKDDTILKERKREKTINWIDHLLNIETSPIKEKREKRDILPSRIEGIKGKLSEVKVLKDRKKIDQSIVSDREKLTRLEGEIDRSERHTVSLEVEIEERMSLLLKVLRDITGKKIEIKF